MPCATWAGMTGLGSHHTQNSLLLVNHLTLTDRRKLAALLFIVNISKRAIDAPHQPIRATRQQYFFDIDIHCITYGSNEIITRLCSTFNNYFANFDLNASSITIKRDISNYLSRAYWFVFIYRILLWVIYCWFNKLN